MIKRNVLRAGWEVVVVVVGGGGGVITRDLTFRSKSREILKSFKDGSLHSFCIQCTQYLLKLNH